MAAVFQTESRSLKQVILTIFLSCVPFLSGCGDSNGLVSTSGTVTFEGQPVETGTVRFYPKDGSRESTGQIGSDGTYTLSTFEAGDGVLPGEYRVSIESKNVKSTGPTPQSDEELIFSPQMRTVIEYLVPEKYASPSTSGLSATVEKKSNTIDFNLE